MQGMLSSAGPCRVAMLMLPILPLRYWENVERKEEAVDVNQENDKNLTDS